MNNENDSSKNEDQNNMRFDFNKNKFALFFLLSLIVMFVLLYIVNDTSQEVEIPYSVFLSYLEQGEVKSVKILDNNEITGNLSSDVSVEHVLFKTRIPYYDDYLMAQLREKGVKVTGVPKTISVGQVILELLPWLLFVGFFWFILRQFQGGGNKAFSFGKSRAKKYHSELENITFDDVAGQDEAKYELAEVVDFLKNPEKFINIGARIPKGVLLVGMPGTGKTLMAKAVAGEAEVPFFHMSGSDFVEMFVGVGASRVRDLFEQGRKNAPCILFIDELDAVGRTRGAGYGGGNDEREQTLNQMLVEMDGFDTKTGVIIIAATNRPDVLDPALLRPGRFDRQIVVDLPDVKEREAILLIHARKIPLAKEVDINKIAKATSGMSGADLSNLINEAALFAARSDSKTVKIGHLEEAKDKLLMGIARKSKVISVEDKTATAYHEAGHALLHYHLKNSDPLHKVTIIPRGRALGMAISLPEKESYSKYKSWLIDRIIITMGGYVAEKLIYGETTTGTQNDIQQATNIARRMITEWGMSDALPFISFGNEEEPIFIGKEIARHKDYSEQTAISIDVEISKILNDSLAKATKILTDNIDQLKLIANALVEKETLDDKDIKLLLGIEDKKTGKAEY